MYLCKLQGKTSLLMRLIGRTGADDIPRSVALEYLFARKVASSGDHHISHIWELAGATLYTNLIQFALNEDTIENISIVLVADLSVPHQLTDTLETLLDFIITTVRDIVSKNGQVKERLRLTTETRIGEKHEDLGVITPILIPMLIIGSKYDIFASKFATNEKKVINGYLRLLAHTHGCSLMYTSYKSESSMNKVTRVLDDLAFSHETHTSIPLSVETSKPLNIPFGSDSFQLIGSPISLDEARRELNNFFPQEQGNFVIPDDAAKDPRYAERQIDLTYSVRKGQLEEFKSRLDLAKVNLALE